MQILRTTYLSIGTNQGDTKKNLQNAVDFIDESIGSVQAISAVYKTAAWGFKGDDFLNICIKVTTNLNPESLLKEIHQIEKHIGRIRSDSEGYENRIIDIDILLFEDEIIFSKTLLVPHKEMIKRNFVMVPLAEIAGNVTHPISKQRISIDAANCEDPTEIEKTDIQLVRPIAISEKFNYIAIEGNIGAGKTTLSNMISDDFNAKMILERFADNPFLPKFYEDNERYAFPLEMSFLADRYQQLTDDLAQYDLFKNFILSDYYIFKSLIFAQITLHSDEFFLYRKMFDIMYKEIAKPDLYIYLYQSTDRLIENIKKRGRDYEQNIEATYLEKIHKGYINFINTEKNLNTLVIDVSEMDFVKNRADYITILNLIKGAKVGEKT